MKVSPCGGNQSSEKGRGLAIGHPRADEEVAHVSMAWSCIRGRGRASSAEYRPFMRAQASGTSHAPEQASLQGEVLPGASLGRYLSLSSVSVVNRAWSKVETWPKSAFAHVHSLAISGSDEVCVNTSAACLECFVSLSRLPDFARARLQAGGSVSPRFCTPIGSASTSLFILFPNPGLPWRV